MLCTTIDRTPYTVTHSDQELRYHLICKNGCPWRLNARRRQSDGKWRISKVVEPHTCLSNRGKKNHQQLTARYLAHRILGLVDDNNDISVSSLQQSISGFVKYGVKYEKGWRAKYIALTICWVVGRKRTTGCPVSYVQCITTTLA